MWYKSSYFQILNSQGSRENATTSSGTLAVCALRGSPGPDRGTRMWQTVEPMTNDKEKNCKKTVDEDAAGRQR